MAFPSSAGYGNLPQGNFSPVLYSQKVLKFFKTVSVADEVTNTEFEGEINQMGDTVRILKQPEVTVSTYTRGQVVTPQDLDDEDTMLVIDQSAKYSFREDDIEKRQSHVSFANMAVEAGAYALRNYYDENVLTKMATSGTTPTSGEVGTTGAPVTIGFSTGSDFTPLDLLNRLARLLDDNEIPDDGSRFVVAKPQFYEYLGKEDSKYIEANTMGDRESFIRARKIGAKPINGMTCYKTTNAPVISSVQTVMAGHTGATATAKNILQSEVLRDQNTFGDIYRGLMVFGREVLRPEALMVSHINYA